MLSKNLASLYFILFPVNDSFTEEEVSGFRSTEAIVIFLSFPNVLKKILKHGQAQFNKIHKINMNEYNKTLYSQVEIEKHHRLWNFESEDSCPQEDQHRNDADPHYTASTDSRDAPLGSTLDDNDYSEFEYETLNKLVNIPTPGKGEVIIAVQCFTISNSILNKNLIQEFTIDNVSLDLDSGVAVVGVIKDVGDGISNSLIGSRVAAVIKTVDKNRRYACVKSDVIVPVPTGLDSSEVAAASYTYFVAFQSLMHGINAPKYRYSGKYLKGKSILIIDGTSAFGQAMIQISRLQGASNIYATAEETNHAYLKGLGSEALSNNPSKWPELLNGSIDIIIVGSRLFRYATAERVLRNSGGKLVYIGSPVTINVLKHCSVDSWMCLFEQFATQCALICSRKAELQATYYDLLESINNYPQQSKVRLLNDGHFSQSFRKRHELTSSINSQNDLKFVLEEMLSKGDIKPKISKFVSADELDYGLVTITSGTIGSIICEPWIRRGPPKEESAYMHMVRT